MAEEFSEVTFTRPDGWKLTMTWGPLHGGPERLVIEPVDPDNPPEGGISHTVLRELDIAGTLRELQEAATVDIDQRAIDELRQAASEGLTDRYLALLAWHYVVRVDAGEVSVPATLAGTLGKSLPTVRNQLGTARRRGLLTGGAGRMGGRLTDKANAILETLTD